MNRCRSCDAPIEWAVTANGKRMPIDAEPTTDGTILLRHRYVGEPPEAIVQTAEERAELERQAATRGEELRLFKSHFATCPNARTHRR